MVVGSAQQPCSLICPMHAQRIPVLHTVAAFMVGGVLHGVGVSWLVILLVVHDVAEGGKTGGWCWLLEVALVEERSIVERTKNLQWLFLIWRLSAGGCVDDSWWSCWWKSKWRCGWLL
jgi:hypothetical protein